MEQVLPLQQNSVKFFDNKNKKFIYYDYYKFNNNLTQLYEQEIIYRKVIIYNKLYILVTNSYNDYFDTKSFSYEKDLYNCYSVINKLFYALRVSLEYESNSFSLENILVQFNTQYFGPSVSKEEFYNFVLGFFVYLETLDVLKINQDRIKFNNNYELDLKKAMYCSFDLMLLGNNKIYDVISTELLVTELRIQSIHDIYTHADQRTKMYIDDMLKCLVIVSTVDTFNVYPDINNLLTELIFNNFALKQ
ncbi:hypothetical protein EON71_00320 [bacterium]|nr:MAG: hypothetical protein EON71_00320 [bacterium]